MTDQAIIDLFVKHISNACELGDIAGCDTMMVLVEDLPQHLQDAINAATC